MRAVLALQLVVVALSLLVVASVVVAAPNPIPTPSRGAGEPFTVFGYLPEYRLGGFNYEAAFQTGLTHLIYFSLEIDPSTGEPSALDRLPSEAQAAEARLAADKVGGKILLSFGGNARSQGFPAAARSPRSRLRFLKGVDRILRKYKFDGVDYNWEYPTSEKEWRDWGQLLRESKAYLLRPKALVQRLRDLPPDEQAAAKKENYKYNVVTFTMYLDPNHYDIIRRFDLLADADYVHCMAYDQHGKHSTYEFAVSGINLAVEKGLPLHKFTLGLPFYGRSIDNGEPKTWYEVSEAMTAKGEAEDLFGRYYFNGKAMIRRKTQLAVDRGIGGVMIWELGQDQQPLSSRLSLMTALNDVVAPLLPARRSKQDSLAERDADL